MGRLVLNDLASTVSTTMDATFDLNGDWDRLLASSMVDTVFLSSAWLRAWRETLGVDARLIIPQIRSNGELIAAAAFQQRDGIIEFAAAGPSDYADIVVSKHVDKVAARNLIWRLIHLTVEQVPGFRHFRLSGIVTDDSATMAMLLEPEKGFFVIPIGQIMAPAMEMSAVEQGLNKKSLKRHERALEKLGTLTTETFRHANEVLPQIDEFFDQHVRRWELKTPTSLFVDDANRDFYRRATEHLDRSGALRYLTVRLDGRLIAAHFGFIYRGRYIWYKPSFELQLAKFSPGEVLIKRLFEAARDEGAAEFDFTIGAEAFKYRFATKARTVVDLHITKSMTTAALMWAKGTARKARDAGLRGLSRHGAPKD